MIKGTQKDYYIAEGEVAEGEDEAAIERPPEFEAKGSGVNTNTYWVSHKSFGDWTKLPDLSPDDIRAARTIKVLFTGDLERTIYTNPYFFGKEKDYVRAQIARISHATTLTPKGFWRFKEESVREIEEATPEEGEMVLPSTKDVAKSDMWLHFKDGILKGCRTTHMEPTDLPEEADPEEEMKKVVAGDPFDEKLKCINGDS